jgi:hypothetical protein
LRFAVLLFFGEGFLSRVTQVAGAVWAAVLDALVFLLRVFSSGISRVTPLLASNAREVWHDHLRYSLGKQQA